MNTVARTIVALVAALVGLTCAAGNAAAHTALISSDPAAGATTESAPTAITLTFTEDINTAFATVVIGGSDGRNWADGPAQVTGRLVRAAVSPDLPSAGGYTIGYRVVSKDGHPVSGSFTFTVAPTPGAAAPPTSASPTSTAASPTTTAPTASGPLGSDTKTSVLTAAAIGLTLGGLIAFWQSRRHRRNNTPNDEPPSPE